MHEPLVFCGGRLDFGEIAIPRRDKRKASRKSANVHISSSISTVSSSSSTSAVSPSNQETIDPCTTLASPFTSTPRPNPASTTSREIEASTITAFAPTDKRPRTGPDRRRGDRLKIARAALEDWRKTHWQQKYDNPGVGPQAMMPDSVLRKLANRTNIRDIAQIKAVTKWDWADEYGLEIVEILEDADARWKVVNNRAIVEKKEKRAQVSAENKVAREELRRQERMIESHYRAAVEMQNTTTMPEHPASAPSLLPGPAHAFQYPTTYFPPPVVPGPSPYLQHYLPSMNSVPPSAPVPASSPCPAAPTTFAPPLSYYWSYTWVPFQPMPLAPPPAFNHGGPNSRAPTGQN